MTTWLMRLDAPGDGPRLAVKDCIDMAGLPTTVGCPVIAERAQPAAADAPVVATARRSGARIVGKANLSELCWSADGMNAWSGTPVNPIDATLSARADRPAARRSPWRTGRRTSATGPTPGARCGFPAACCGIAGLKTTWGRIPAEGVYPLAPSLDTVGPLGRDVAAVELGMRLLEPGFTAPAYDGPMTIGRLRPLRPALEIRPEIDAAVDAALAAAGFGTESVPDVDFGSALDVAGILIDREGSCRTPTCSPTWAGSPGGTSAAWKPGPGWATPSWPRPAPGRNRCASSSPAGCAGFPCSRCPRWPPRRRRSAAAAPA